jgi:uncharacterized coiled-coil protein SlyX
MNDPIHLAKAFRFAKDSPNRCQVRRGFFLLALVLAWFTPLPVTEAINPPPDGGYPNQNTAEGEDALFSLTIGGFDNQDNTAIGFDALFSSTNTFFNTAVGSQALFSSTLSEANTAVGYKAMFGNTTGSFNTATGQQALAGNNTGFSNTADGSGALFANTTGEENTASGAAALADNTTGDFNTANGSAALSRNRSGTNNTADGTTALLHNKTGNNNTADGVDALRNNTTGDGNIAVGRSAGSNLTTGSNNIDIGNPGVKDESNTIRIGRVGTQDNAYIAGISGVTVAGGVGVIVDNNGHLGTVVSSERFKTWIRPMDKASEAIFSLQPVAFRYKEDLDPAAIPQFGLVAEQVAKVDPDLVARDDQGKPYTVRYEAVNAMLLNEFLKEHRKVEAQATKSQEQDATIAQLKSAIAQQQKEIQVLTASLKEQAAQIQTVSDRLEKSRPAPRLVANDQ